MSSVGFSSQLPSVTDFLANQGAFIDTQILMVIIGSAEADSISKTIASQATKLAGLMARADAINTTATAMTQMAEKVIKPEVDAVDAKYNDLNARQNQNPVPATGAKPNLDSWTYGGTLTYSDDADAKFLKDRGLPVAVYVPAQSKTFTVTNPAWQQAWAAANAAYTTWANTPASPPEPKQAAWDDYVAKVNHANSLPSTIQVTQTAPAVGTPDAYNKNKETIAAYKQSLLDGTADNQVVNDLTKNSADLNALSGELAGAGVEKPTKYKDINGAATQLVQIATLYLATTDQARQELFDYVDKAGASFEFLNNLAAELGKDGQKQVNKLQEKVAGLLEDVDLGRFEPVVRNAVEDALFKLASVLPEGDVQAMLQSLPPDQQEVALKQISAFQKELDARQGDAAPPANAPNLSKLNSRFLRV